MYVTRRLPSLYMSVSVSMRSNISKRILFRIFSSTMISHGSYRMTSSVIPRRYRGIIISFCVILDIPVIPANANIGVILRQ
jgi:hypothetical protein